MVLQAFPGTEPVLKKPGKEFFFFGESDDAVTNVARGKDVEFLTETAAGTAVIADGDDCGEAADGSGGRKRLVFRSPHVSL